MSVITDCPYICAPNIMDTPDYQTKMVTLDMADKPIIKAGTPISAEGKVANDETAIGILFNDCHACLGAHRGLVVISGRVKQDVAAEHSGITISDEAKSAMINLTFTGDGARGGGGGVKTVNGSEPDKNGNVEVVTGTQPDWNQRDTTALDYIKNRTHYYEEPTVITLSSTAISASVFGNTMYKASDLKPTATELTGAKVISSGTEYTITSDAITDSGAFYYVTYLPNPSYVSYGYVSICVAKYAGSGYVTISGSSYQYSFPSPGIYFFQNVTKLEYGGVLKRLDEKFLPESLSVDPVFTGSFSQNRSSGTTIGTNSHAEGGSTIASGAYAHSEGQNTSASGSRSHAEGQNTSASGADSHAEGNLTSASGGVSHAEGQYTFAEGLYSHAEGNGTIAKRRSQHVQGEFNIATAFEDSTSRSGYAHIVGNGTSDSERSNAHTLSWGGVPWFQGRPQFGGTKQDDGSRTVVGNGDKEIILTSSTADSTKRFRITVDDSGTLSATEVTE